MNKMKLAGAVLLAAASLGVPVLHDSDESSWSGVSEPVQE